jgi:L-alanine-DL-glutamate epimerase-like enolase superfamily enzyme
MKSDIKIISAKPYFSKEACRTPLKFGKVIVDKAIYAQVKVTVANRKGEESSGWGGIFLSDMWAFPSSLVPHEEREKAMQKITGEFSKLVEEYPSYAHPVDIFLDREEDLKKITKSVSRDLSFREEMPFLGALVSASPVDAAIHDAFGKVNKISTYQGYGREFMKHDLSRYLGGRFKGKYLGDYIRKSYAPQLPVFHLVGALDKLRDLEINENDPQDGLPNSLEEWVRRDGLVCLKIKLKGNDLGWDVERVLQVAQVSHQAQAKKQELSFSVDTNEQCESPEYIIEMLNKIKEHSPKAFKELLFVEQPTERDLTAHRFPMHKLSKIKPVIIDESLTDLGGFDLALELGWSGIALKSCKCQSTALLFAARAEEEKIPYTVQDLTNPGISLIHSVGLAARLNPLKGVESNSSQFFPRISRPEEKVHPGIFRRKEGMVTTESIKGYGLGYQIERIERDIFKE